MVNVTYSVSVNVKTLHFSIAFNLKKLPAQNNDSRIDIGFARVFKSFFSIQTVKLKSF